MGAYQKNQPVSRVALYTEGTYPQAHGGVSVWVNQLVHGLSDHQFEVRAISGAPYHQLALELPSNVSAEQVPLWGAPARARRHSAYERRQATEAYSELITALCTFDVTRFGAALRALSQLGQAGSLTALLDTPQASRLTFDIWSACAQQTRPHPSLPRLPVPTVADALNVHLWLEHALRPLATRPPQAEIGHAVSNGFAALLALHGLWTHNTPFVLTEHGVYLRERYIEMRSTEFSLGFKGLLLRFHRLVCSLAYCEAALVLPGSHYNRRWEERLGALPEQIECVYNGIDPAVFPAAQHEPYGPVVSWVGRVDPLKDLETLIRAFKLVCQRIPHAQLRLFGATPAGNESYERHCRQVSADLKMERNITFEGRVPDITEAYRAGQVVALTSVSEGFPYTVIEAMAMGRPPVVTRVGGVPEAVGEAGIIVSPRDPVGFAGGLTKLLENAPLRVALGQAARARVMTLFTLEGCLEAYRRAYPVAKQSDWRQLRGLA